MLAILSYMLFLQSKTGFRDGVEEEGSTVNVLRFSKLNEELVLSLLFGATIVVSLKPFHEAVVHSLIVVLPSGRLGLPVVPPPVVLLSCQFVDGVIVAFGL